MPPEDGNVDEAVNQLFDAMPEEKPQATPMLDAFNAQENPEPDKEPTEEPKVEVESREPATEEAELAPVSENADDTPQEEPQGSQSLRDIMAKLSAQDAENRRLRDALKQRPEPTPEGQKGPDLYEMAKKKDVNGLFRELGLTFDDALEDWNPNEEKEPAQINKQVERQIQELKDHNSQLQNQFQAMRNENFVTTEKNSFATQVSKTEDKYPMILRAFKDGDKREAMEIAMQLAQNVYNQTQIVPDKADILDEVEKMYHNRVQKYSKWAPQDAPEATPEPVKPKAESKTAPSPDGNDDTKVSRELTEEERFEQALLKLTQDIAD